MTATSSHSCLPETPRKHPELLPKLFVLPKVISHQKLAPFPPSPPAEGSRNLLTLHSHSHSHQGQNWGHHLGDNKVLEVLLSSWSQTPEPCREQGDLEGAAQDIPRHFPVKVSDFGMSGKGPLRASRQENLHEYLGCKKENQGENFPPFLPNLEPLSRV